VGFGTSSTIYRIQPGSGARPQALKVFRRSAGRERTYLLDAARALRRRHLALRRAFGPLVLDAQFLVLPDPLRGVPAAACLQPWLETPRDVLGLEDEALLRLLGSDPELARSFRAFAHTALACHAQRTFPDVLARDSLVAVPATGGLDLKLTTTALLEARPPFVDGERLARIESVARRLETLLRRLRSHGESSR